MLTAIIITALVSVVGTALVTKKIIIWQWKKDFAKLRK